MPGNGLFMYNIEFINSHLGRITIDDFAETFQSDFSYWSQARYESQWLKAEELLKNGFPALFITSITNPEHADFIRTWVCYPQGNERVFQEWILFLSDLSGSFDINNPHKHIPAYENVSEDGEQISEWRTSAE